MQHQNQPLGVTPQLDVNFFQPWAPPIVAGVPRLLFTDEEVASMYGFSVSTVRNRYNPGGEWFDPNFPQPRSTDGSGKGRKAAVRWHWADLCRYANNLPTVSSLRQVKPVPDLKAAATHESVDKPFRV